MEDALAIKLLNRLRHRLVSTGLYLAMGWVVLLAAGPLVARLPAAALTNRILAHPALPPQERVAERMRLRAHAQQLGSGRVHLQHQNLQYA